LIRLISADILASELGSSGSFAGSCRFQMLSDAKRPLAAEAGGATAVGVGGLTTVGVGGLTTVGVGGLTTGGLMAVGVGGLTPVGCDVRRGPLGAAAA
jgi:hypothetical protein